VRKKKKARPCFPWGNGKGGATEKKCPFSWRKKKGVNLVSREKDGKHRKRGGGAKGKKGNDISIVFSTEEGPSVRFNALTRTRRLFKRGKNVMHDISGEGTSLPSSNRGALKRGGGGILQSI